MICNFSDYFTSLNNSNTDHQLVPGPGQSLIGASLFGFLPDGRFMTPFSSTNFCLPPLSLAVHDLLITSHNICSRFLPLVTFPFILSSIISRRSESCLRMCPIHLNLRCCTVSKMLLFSCTFCSTCI